MDRELLGIRIDRYEGDGSCHVAGCDADWTVAGSESTWDVGSSDRDLDLCNHHSKMFVQLSEVSPIVLDSYRHELRRQRLGELRAEVNEAFDELERGRY